MRIEDANRKPDLLGDNAHRLCKIGIIGDENGNLEPLRVGIAQQVGRDLNTSPPYEFCNRLLKGWPQCFSKRKALSTFSFKAEATFRCGL